MSTPSRFRTETVTGNLFSVQAACVAVANCWATFKGIACWVFRISVVELTSVALASFVINDTKKTPSADNIIIPIICKV